jgi:hypothetical protein
MSLLAEAPDPIGVLARRDARAAVMPVDAGLPAPCDTLEDFVFVSYKREDLARIAPILRGITEGGLPIWYDRGIPGGAEWDAIIEEHLTGCRCVLLFASPAAIASKYVRREVKFADALDTPILCVLLDPTPLTDGMGMLLSQYQMLDARAADFPTQMRRALDHLIRGRRGSSGSASARGSG